MTSVTIPDSVRLFIQTLSSSRSENTRDTYSYAMRAFIAVLSRQGIEPETTSVSALEEEMIEWFTAALKEFSPATEDLYLQAISRYFEFLDTEQIISPNMSLIRRLIRNGSRKKGEVKLKFAREDIEKVLEFAETLPHFPTEDPNEHLRNLRDRAFLLTLADTGLRVHEICKLVRGDIDWNEGRAIVIGKGNKQAVVRFSGRSMAAIRDYLSARSKLDGGSGRQLRVLPLFARHDKGAGKKTKPITTATGRNIVEERVTQALGDERAGNITPHSFRHYFVTTVLRATGNLKLAQELARHANISVTQRYAHLSDDELDKGYHEIFK